MAKKKKAEAVVEVQEELVEIPTAPEPVERPTVVDRYCQPEVVDSSFMNKWVENMPESEYHADNSAVHSGGVNMMINTSPQHFDYYYNRATRKEETSALRLGKLAHVMVLEPGRFREKYIVCPDFGDMRKPVNRDLKKEWYDTQSPDAVIVDQKSELDKLLSIAQNLAANPLVVNVLKDGMPEFTGYYRDRETDLKCVIRPDFVVKNTLVYIDFKTSRSASKKDWGNSMVKYGYDVQMAHYWDGIAEITNTKPEGAAWIIVETTAPYAVNVLMVDDMILNAGRIKRREAMHKIRACVDSNKWPSYSDGKAETAQLPEWYLRSFENMEG